MDSSFAPAIPSRPTTPPPSLQTCIDVTAHLAHLSDPASLYPQSPSRYARMAVGDAHSPFYCGTLYGQLYGSTHPGAGQEELDGIFERLGEDMEKLKPVEAYQASYPFDRSPWSAKRKTTLVEAAGSSLSIIQSPLLSHSSSTCREAVSYPPTLALPQPHEDIGAIEAFVAEAISSPACAAGHDTVASPSSTSVPTTAFATPVQRISEEDYINRCYNGDPFVPYNPANQPLPAEATANYDLPSPCDDLRADTILPFDIGTSSKALLIRDAFPAHVWNQYDQMRRARALSEGLHAIERQSARQISLPLEYEQKAPFLLRNVGISPSPRRATFHFCRVVLPSIEEDQRGKGGDTVSLDMLADIADRQRRPMAITDSKLNVPSSPTSRDEWDTTDVEAASEIRKRAGRGKVFSKETMARMAKEVKEELLEEYMEVNRPAKEMEPSVKAKRPASAVDREDDVIVLLRDGYSARRSKRSKTSAIRATCQSPSQGSTRGTTTRDSSTLPAASESQESVDPLNSNLEPELTLNDVMSHADRPGGGSRPTKKKPKVKEHRPPLVNLAQQNLVQRKCKLAGELITSKIMQQGNRRSQTSLPPPTVRRSGSDENDPLSLRPLSSSSKPRPSAPAQIQGRATTARPNASPRAPRTGFRRRVDEPQKVRLWTVEEMILQMRAESSAQLVDFYVQVSKSMALEGWHRTPGAIKFRCTHQLNKRIRAINHGVYLEDDTGEEAIDEGEDADVEGEEDD